MSEICINSVLQRIKKLKSSAKNQKLAILNKLSKLQAEEAYLKKIIVKEGSKTSIRDQSL